MRTNAWIPLLKDCFFPEMFNVYTSSQCVFILNATIILRRPVITTSSSGNLSLSQSSSCSSSLHSIDHLFSGPVCNLFITRHSWYFSFCLCSYLPLPLTLLWTLICLHHRNVFILWSMNNIFKPKQLNSRLNIHFLRLQNHPVWLKFTTSVLPSMTRLIGLVLASSNAT